jgi:hypothetical protein
MEMTSDEQVIMLYRTWSEEYWCAGFIKPSELTVRDFREYLSKGYHVHPREGYETEMLKEYHRQLSYHKRRRKYGPRNQR